MPAMSLTPPLRSTADVDELVMSLQRSYEPGELEALARLDADDLTREKAALALSATRLLWALEDAARGVN